MTVEQVGVLPAQAGMIFVVLQKDCLKECAPRASGDDQGEGTEQGLVYVCSPRKRG